MAKKNVLAVLPAILLLFSSCTLGPGGKYVFGRGERVAAVKNEHYKENCGECHFAYQPGLLPKRSWDRMMETAELEEHFGEYLEFETQDHKAIKEYLEQNSAEKSLSGLSNKILESIAPNEKPLRITKTEYYQEVHEDIPLEEAVIQNDEVKSLSNCKACHFDDAELGVFIENDDIPGYDD